MLKINELALDAVKKALAATDNAYNLTEYPLSSREKVKVFAIILRRRLYFFTLKTLPLSVFSSKTLLFAVRADKGRRHHSPSAPSCPLVPNGVVMNLLRRRRRLLRPLLSTQGCGISPRRRHILRVVPISRTLRRERRGTPRRYQSTKGFPVLGSV